MATGTLQVNFKRDVQKIDALKMVILLLISDAAARRLLSNHVAQ